MAPFELSNGLSSVSCADEEDDYHGACKHCLCDLTPMEAWLFGDKCFVCDDNMVDEEEENRNLAALEDAPDV